MTGIKPMQEHRRPATEYTAVQLRNLADLVLVAKHRGQLEAVFKAAHEEAKRGGYQVRVEGLLIPPVKRRLRDVAGITVEELGGASLLSWHDGTP